MKTAKIYVGANGASLSFASSRGVAVYPAQKGEKESYVLMESGKLASIKGNRINGVGVPRYLQENGFVLAAPGDPLAAQLADLLDVREGTKLVEKASQKQAVELQRRFAGQTCTFVPFDASRPCVPVDIDEPRGYVTTTCDLVAGFSAGTVRIANTLMDIALSKGWLVGPEGNASAMPRVSDYGGLVEQAVYVLCNCGLGTLEGAPHLVMSDCTAEDDPYPRGLLKLALENGDRVHVAIDGGDELVVLYLRNGDVLYTRSGMNYPRLGDVIGAIAAVLVRVQELDTAPVKKSRKQVA